MGEDMGVEVMTIAFGSAAGVPRNAQMAVTVATSRPEAHTGAGEVPEEAALGTVTLIALEVGSTENWNVLGKRSVPQRRARSSS